MIGKNWENLMLEHSGWVWDFTEHHGLPPEWVWPDVYEFMGLRRDYYRWTRDGWMKDYLDFCKLGQSPLFEALR